MNTHTQLLRCYYNEGISSINIVIRNFILCEKCAMSVFFSEQQFDTARQQSQSSTVDQPQGLRAGQTPSDSTRSSLSLRRH